MLSTRLVVALKSYKKDINIMKKFKPSLTAETKFIVGFLLFFWIVGTLISFDSNSLRETANISFLTFIFCFAFGYGWFKQTYLVISDNEIKYVSFFFQRKTAKIPEVKMVTTSTVADFMKFLCVVHYHNDKEKLLQISPVGFSKQTLNGFVSELRKINPNIEVHKSAEELLKAKTKKALAVYQTAGLSGAIISFVMIFVGIYYKDIGMFGLLVPLGLALGAFFIGYGMKGKLKDGFKWVFYFIIFGLIIALIQFLLDLIDSIIFDDDVLTIRGFVPLAISESAGNRALRARESVRCPRAE